MPLPATTQWICDHCGDLITQADQGMVEWLDLPTVQGQPKRSHKIRIVHHVGHGSTSNGCQYREAVEHTNDQSIVADLPLADLLGADGLVQLLEMLAEQRLPKEEVLEIFKRIHIPGYEEARLHFQAALAEGVIEPDVAPGYYRQEAIQKTLDFASRPE